MSDERICALIIIGLSFGTMVLMCVFLAVVVGR